MKKIISFIICLAMILTYLPVPAVWAEDTALPQTPEAYAQSDYAKYGARMAVGEAHMAVVKADGTVVVWGQVDTENEDKTKWKINAPEDLSNVKAIAAGAYHTLALKADGTIVGWGSSIYNIDGDTEPYAIPSKLQSEHFQSIAAGGNMSAAVKTDGTVAVWGFNSYGMITSASAITNAVSVAINDSGAVALDQSGKVTYWGDGGYAADAPTCGGIVAVAAGFNYWAALKNDGTAVVWGAFPSATMKNIMGITEIRAVAAGHRMTVALLKDGSVKSFVSSTSAIPNNLGGKKLNTATSVSAIVVAPEWMQKCHALIMQSDGTVDAYSGNVSLLNMPENLNLLSNTPSKSKDCDLSSLSVADYSLSPDFHAETTGYTFNVPNVVTGVAVTATASSVKATLEINGGSAESGTAYTIKDLAVGNNEISVKVTAEDDTVKTYTITAIRAGESADKSSDAALSVLSVEGYSLSPDFHAETTSYAISVPNNVTQVAITATASDVKATMKINEADAQSGIAYTVKNLVVGNNNISVKVTAEDGTDKIYTITAIRAEDNTVKSSNAALSSLSVAGFDLSPDFDKEVTDYTISSSNDVTGVAVTAVTSDSKATLAINAKTAESGISGTFGLYVGVNPIDVKVTAEDGTIKTYTITVYAAEYDGPSPGIPQTMKAYNASEYAQALNKVVGKGNFLFINQDGSVTRYKNIAHYLNPIGIYDLPGDLDHVKKAVEGEFTVVALKQDGTVEAWGDNTYGLCNVPEGLSGVEDIAMNTYSHCCLALKEDGTVTAWGDNTYGLCDVPSGLYGVKDIFAASFCFLALKQDGTVAVWGNSPYGLNNLPKGLSKVTELAIDPQGMFALALKGDGTVAAWGDNDHGECNVPSDLKNVACIKAKIWNAIAVREDGSVVIWGDNAYGQCNVPEGLKNVVCISDSDQLMCVAALRADGTVAAWGYKSDQVKNMPAGLHDVVQVRTITNSGGARIWAVRKDGTVSVWGSSWGSFDVENQLIKDENVLFIGKNFILHRGGTLESYEGNGISSFDIKDIQKVADGVNVLSGHCFAVNDAELLDSEGNRVTSVTAGETCQIKADINNYYCEDSEGTVLIQVRGGEGASASGGGRVLSCISLEKDVPLEGTTVSSDFTMPENISGTVYIDIFVWDKGDKPVPKTEPDQSLMITVNQ